MKKFTSYSFGTWLLVIVVCGGTITLAAQALKKALLASAKNSQHVRLTRVDSCLPSKSSITVGCNSVF